MSEITPGTMTTSQRRAQLEETRFIDIRNLAFLKYKKSDGNPLLTYEETLSDRDAVKLAVLQYEIANGWLIPDGTEGQTHVQAVPQSTNTGVPQMTTPFAPQMPAQQPTAFAAPQGMQAPVAQPQAFGAPPQQQQMQFAPQAAAPQQAQQAPQAPAQQEAPAAAPTGRGRRSKAATGAAVAAPPAAPPPDAVAVQTFAQPGPQFAPQAAPQQAPQAFGAPPQFAPQGQAFTPVPNAPTGAPPMFAPQAQAPVAAPPAPAGVDLTPLIQRLDELGKLTSALSAELAASVAREELLFVAVAHLYFTNTSLAPMMQQANVNQTPAALREYLKKFLVP